MLTLKVELIRLSIFLFIVFTMIMLKWWIILIAFVLFPWVLKAMRNKRNGKINLGYLVNYITNRIVRR